MKTLFRFAIGTLTFAAMMLFAGIAITLLSTESPADQMPPADVQVQSEREIINTLVDKPAHESAPVTSAVLVSTSMGKNSSLDNLVAERDELQQRLEKANRQLAEWKAYGEKMTNFVRSKGYRITGDADNDAQQGYELVSHNKTCKNCNKGW